MSYYTQRVMERYLLGTLLALVWGLGACQSPMPGYRHEGLGPDERLLELADRLALQREAGPENSDGEPMVDGGRLHNELRRLNLEYPAHVPTLFMLATVEFGQGNEERASAYLAELSSLQPIHPEAGLLRSQVAIHDGNLNGARRVLEQQIRYTPDHAGMREAYGSVLFMEGDLEAARGQLEMAHRLGAPTWRVAYNLGLIEESAGDYMLALKNYELVLSERPGFRPAASRRAGLVAEFGEVVP